MKRMTIALAAAALVACAGSETPPADSAAAAPAALTADMVTGTWSGVSMAETSDSVTSRWTAIRTAEGSKLVVEGRTDTIVSTAVFDADSIVSTSQPFASAAEANAPQVTIRSVMRLVDGKLVGTSATRLASNPDSVLSRTRFEATRVP